MKLERIQEGLFNPSIAVLRGDEYLAFRRDKPPWNSGKSAILVSKNGSQPLVAKVGVEDPRLFVYAGHLLCSYNTTFAAKGCCIGVMELDGPSVVSDRVLKYGAPIEKNWAFFSFGTRIYCIYNHNPYTVLSFGANWSISKKTHATNMSWDYGPIRGGTPPARIGDNCYTFFHSSLPTKHVGICVGPYYTGCLEFSARPPFAPKRYTKKPLYSPTGDEDLAIFPGGAVFRDGTWRLACGRNNVGSCILEIPHSEVERAL
uniref:Uncharacterized protein n=1 Tax=viral metagenome TaxID=1070528 RepID=A0A6H1ZGZ6_9ZZZZ